MEKNHLLLIEICMSPGCTCNDICKPRGLQIEEHNAIGKIVHGSFLDANVSFAFSTMSGASFQSEKYLSVFIETTVVPTLWVQWTSYSVSAPYNIVQT